MKKTLVTLLAVIIIGIGIVGFKQLTDNPDEVIQDNNHSKKSMYRLI
ncbi:hypothetical protein CV093_19400 [Oceanobacillus sp. 143]|nr:hypothetical protein CV093_19400 [Oceanobacillus sp. 143]